MILSGMHDLFFVISTIIINLVLIETVVYVRKLSHSLPYIFPFCRFSRPGDSSCSTSDGVGKRKQMWNFRDTVRGHVYGDERKGKRGKERERNEKEEEKEKKHRKDLPALLEVN